jgi:hypothetical protein
MYILCVRLRETTLYRLSLFIIIAFFWLRVFKKVYWKQYSQAVLWLRIWISRVRKFLGLPDPDPSLFVRIRIRIWILTSSSKKSKKILISTVLFLLYDFLSFKNYVNVPSKSNKQRILEKNLFLLASWKPPDENSRIRIRIHKSVIRICGTGSVPKCHGSTTLLTGLVVKEWF